MRPRRFGGEAKAGKAPGRAPGGFGEFLEVGRVFGASGRF